MKDDKIIYITNEEVNKPNPNMSQEIPQEEQKNIKQPEKKKSLYKYLTTILLAILIYVLCAWSSQVPMSEIIDVELPTIVFASLIITCLVENNYEKIAYIGYLIVICVIYLIQPSYAFLILSALIAQACTSITYKIFYNVYDYNINNTEVVNKKQSRIIQYYHRMKYHIALSIVIFIAFTLLSYYYPSVFQQLVMPALQGMNEGVNNGTVQLSTVPLFTNNFTVAINMFLGGAYFSIVTLYLLIYNALVIGFTGSTLPIVYYLTFTLPHGIVELTAIILSGAAGFRLTQAIITILSGIPNDDAPFTDYVIVGGRMIVDSLILLVIFTILLIIAAFIEANLTIPLGTTILGLI